MKFIFITNRSDVASFAAQRGADWVMIDLEKVGKHERQGHLDTLISEHAIVDIAVLRRTVPPGRLLVRTDPVNAASADQIEGVVAAGADWVMLPFFRSLAEVNEFSRMVDGRAEIVLLAETRESVELLRECCAVPGVGRVHIGLNDLSLDLGKRFMFELLVDGTVERMARDIRASGTPFGIGGIARVDEGLVPAQDILVQHARLGSDAAILSRTFHRNATSVADIESDMNFAVEVQKLRAAHAGGLAMSEPQRAVAIETMRATIEAIATTMPHRAAAASSTSVQ